MKGAVLHMITREQGGKVTKQVCLCLSKLIYFDLWFASTFQLKLLLCVFHFASAEAGTDWRQSPNLQDFLLQSSDEEDVCSLELSDPQRDLEEDIMTYFDKTPKNNSRPLCVKLSKYSTISYFSVFIKFGSNF